MEYTTPEHIREVPNLLGLLLASVTMFAGTVFEDKEVTCGKCQSRFVAAFKRDDTKHATCPVCKTVNSW